MEATSSCEATNEAGRQPGLSTKDGGQEAEGDGEPSTSSSTSGSFECNICLEPAKDAVVSKCGHLFCWPCLHQWLETVKSHPSCPVCKAGISKESVIPLYGRGGDHKKDPRSKIPPRPPGQPSPNENSGNRNSFSRFGNFFGGGGGGGGNFQMSVGFGPFPFGLFTAFNLDAGGGNATGVANSRDDQAVNDAETMSKFFMMMAVVFILWSILS